MSGKEWVRAINRIVSRADVPVTIGGGEPTKHPDFYYIIRNIKPELGIDLLTNLEFNVDEFMANIPLEKIKLNPFSDAAIRVSYNPGITDFDQLAAKTLKLKQHGYSIGIWTVAYPGYAKEIRIARQKSKMSGVDFYIKEFLGWHHGRLYGHYKYPDAIGKDKTRKVLCRTVELSVSPNGNIHRCQRDIFSGENPIGHILDPKFQIEDKFRPCNSYGKCNPCSVKIRTRPQKHSYTLVEIQKR
jgi:MoaA/NifB/PqqE/SkfB family radical SAM enzyme